MGSNAAPARRRSVRRRPGQFIEIDLGNGARGFGRVLCEPEFAFYDLIATSAPPPPLDELGAKPIAFRLWVMNRAISSGRWKVIGATALPDELIAPAVYFKQDPFTGKLAIYSAALKPPTYERPATRRECEPLERAAVWDPEHVEDRLRDHFAGQPNNWVRSLQLDPLAQF
ncbi:MAG TPA: immunity 26/phosphotriesterase HocA family protein [Caulobacteraceae bacterium]|jgi:hypothetical protein